MADPRPVPLLDVRRDDVDDALRSVHERRRRSALVGASSLACVVALGAVVGLARSTGPASLRPVGPGLPVPVETPPSNEPHRAQPSVATYVERTLHPDPTPTPPRGEMRPPMFRGHTTPDPTPDQGQLCSDPWCTSATATPAGDVLRFEISVCRGGPQTTGADLSYVTTQEADFAVLDGQGREVWRWSTGGGFPWRPHAHRLDPGGCYFWLVNWDRTLPNARPLAPGDYTLVATSSAKEVPGEETVTFTAP